MGTRRKRGRGQATTLRQPQKPTQQELDEAVAHMCDMGFDCYDKVVVTMCRLFEVNNPILCFPNARAQYSFNIGGGQVLTIDALAGTHGTFRLFVSPS